MNKISIVITTFNDEKNIINVLKNIYVDQSYKVDEIVICDGGSKDKTVNVIKNYSKENKINIKLISDGKRRNISEGLNQAIKMATNYWILIIGTGNSYQNDFIEKIINAQSKHKVDLVYGPILGIDKTFFGKIFNQYFLNGNKSIDMGASNHGVLINKKIFEKYGYFYEKFIYAGEDTEFYIRLKNNFVKAYYEKEAILYWDTPQTVNEYLKKMRVNSIADWQIFKRRKVWIKIITPIILLILYSILVLLNPCFTLLILPLIACIAVKKRTFNILAILLGIITKYVMVYYYLKNIKYSNSKYHIQKNYEL